MVSSVMLRRVVLTRSARRNIPEDTILRNEFFSNYIGALSKEKMIREQKLLSEKTVAVSVLSAHDVSSGVPCGRKRPLLVIREGKSRPDDVRQVSARTP
jgi:hypothetical protein